MDQSNPPKDVLGLGRHLVRELDFEDGVDTLGRWMAHHLAELMRESEKGKTIAKRTKAKKQATETILTIWDHRKSLQRESYPLAKYEDLLRVIDRLQIDANPYRFFVDFPESHIDSISSQLFDNLTRLILSLLLMSADSLKTKEIVDEAVIDALDEQEKRVWFAIQEWVKIFPRDPDNNKSDGNEETNKKAEKFDRRKNLLVLLDNVSQLLDSLRMQLDDDNEEQVSVQTIVKLPKIS